MRRDPLSFYTAVQREYGHYARICAVPNTFVYMLTHPDAIEHVLLKGHRNYRKPDIFYKAIGLIGGDGLFTSEGDLWKRQRQMAQPAFHSSYLATLVPRMVQGARQFIAERDRTAGETFDMSEDMMRLGLRIASTTLFSADISAKADRIGRAFRTALAHVSRRLNSIQIIPIWFPTPANVRFTRAKKLLDKAVAEIISNRQRTSDRPDDLLTMLLAAHDQTTGDKMPTRLLMDEVLTLMTAGHETIGAALAWSWYLLAKHPQIQEQLFDEVHSRLRGRDPGAQDLEHLPLARAVFEESLRLYPPGWGEMRQTIDADEINGYPIPPKSLVLLCQWVTHRHRDFWEDPEQFKPQRFLDASPDRHRFAYFPFGGGPRICIGTQFALMEGPLVLATIAQHFRVKLTSPAEPRPDATFVLRPKGGLKVILERR
jgi:cytochrome P450